MRFDDLLGDRQAEAGMGPELLARRALGVEAVEDRRQLFLWDTGSFILDGHKHRPAVVPCGEPDLAVRRAKGDGVRDDVAKYLRQSSLDARDDEPATTVGKLDHQMW